MGTSAIRILSKLLLAGLFLLLPAPAWAWGPAAHLDFSLAVMKDLALLAPAVAALLVRFREDFLYGSLAADITVAKNLSPYHLHCHSWQVGFSVLDRAESDDTRAFAWGYLSHLAADVVAHNYFIPYKMIEHYQRRRAPHAYWEMRFDTRVAAESWREARSLSTRVFGGHDRHLRQILTGSLLPFRVNKQIFNSMVLFNRMARWQRMVDAHARRSAMRLTEEEAEEMRRLSLQRVQELLTHCRQAGCLAADPAGHRNILIARDVRKRLRRLNLQGRLLDPAEMGSRYRPLFREAMESKLSLPSMQELIDPRAPALAPKRRRRFGHREKEPAPLVLPARRRRLLGRKKNNSGPLPG